MEDVILAGGGTAKGISSYNLQLLLAPGLLPILAKIYIRAIELLYTGDIGMRTLNLYIIASAMSIASGGVAADPLPSHKLQHKGTNISLATSETCSNFLPRNLESYCSMSWNKKWDFTESYSRFTSNNGQYKNLFERLESLLGYNHGYLSGVGYAESRFKGSAASSVNALGVMQIMENGPDIKDGYAGFILEYESARSLVQRYVNKDSVNKISLNNPATNSYVKFARKPSFDEITRENPGAARLLLKMYNIRSTEELLDVMHPSIWNNPNVKKPSPDELEVIIRHVFVPLYVAIEHAKSNYFNGQMPSYQKIKENPQTNIVIGALMFDLGKRELSILSRTAESYEEKINVQGRIKSVQRQRTHFTWRNPDDHINDGTSAVIKNDLELMAFGPYNAGFVATVYRLQLMYDNFKFTGPLGVIHALNNGAYLKETRIGIMSIRKWQQFYTHLEEISRRYLNEQLKER